MPQWWLRTFLGNATAAVKVKQEESIFFGAGTVETTTRVCVVCYVDVPLVTDAKQYTGAIGVAVMAAEPG